MSGYGDTLEVVELIPEFNASLNETLLRLMEFEKTETANFTKLINNLGFNFQIIFEWLKEPKPRNVNDFIDKKIAITISKIKEIFVEQLDLFKTLISIENFEDFKPFSKDRDFLQKNNILVQKRGGKYQWHDRVTEKVFEELKKRKPN